MKRKIEKVTPKAGTLKQANQVVRNGMSLSGKMSAFILLLTMAFSTMSFVQDDDTLTNGSSISTSSSVEKADSCCTSKTAVQAGRKMIKLYDIPTAEMLRRSDYEAYSNLKNSLTENRLKALQKWLSLSDYAMQNAFRKETSVEMNGLLNSVASDEMINNYFSAENLSININSYAAASDIDVNDLFTAEHVGIESTYNDIVVSDASINDSFEIATTKITTPGVEMFSKADAEIHNNLVNEMNALTVAKAKK
jgi:hypothetical protein